MVRGDVYGEGQNLELWIWLLTFYPSTLYSVGQLTDLPLLIGYLGWLMLTTFLAECLAESMLSNKYHQCFPGK